MTLRRRCSICTQKTEDAINVNKPINQSVNQSVSQSVCSQRYDKPHLTARCCHVAIHLTNFTGDRQTNEQTDRRTSASPKAAPAFASEALRNVDIGIAAICDVKLRRQSVMWGRCVQQRLDDAVHDCVFSSWIDKKINYGLRTSRSEVMKKWRPL